jgi:GTP1/Obg family GTP-binding protein
MTDVFDVVSAAEQKTQEAAKGFGPAKAALDEACKKKERKRKAKRKKKKECKKITSELKDLPDDNPSIDKLKPVVDALGELTVSFSDVKTAVDKIIGNHKEQTDAATAYGEAQKKADEIKAKFEQQKKQSGELAKKLKDYCTAD